MRSSDLLLDSKMSKKAPRFIEFNLLTNRHRQERILQNERRREGLPNSASDFFFFALVLNYDLSKFSNNVTRFLDHKLSPWEKFKKIQGNIL